jgi:hypothetical protein
LDCHRDIGKKFKVQGEIFSVIHYTGWLKNLNRYWQTNSQAFANTFDKQTVLHVIECRGVVMY